MGADLVVGAVAYTANVVPIWEGIREYFRDGPAPMDFVLFSNYERQVDALLAGHIDIAWNTNVAWVRTLRRSGGSARALAMRDTDLTFRTLVVARAGRGLKGLDSLRGTRVALGSRDSAQARILPIHFLARAGIGSEDVDLVLFDSDVGKHGDTGRSDLDALRAVADDDADVAAVGSNTWQSLGAAGDAAVADFEVVWASEDYCHCNFTALPTLGARSRRALGRAPAGDGLGRPGAPQDPGAGRPPGVAATPARGVRVVDRGDGRAGHG
jgi:phosphonate transport system substrate-binding protein